MNVKRAQYKATRKVNDDQTRAARRALSKKKAPSKS